MEKSMSSRDRLSELPNSVIVHIFGFLTMSDVVRTTILSKRWNTLWTTTTCLTFDDHEMVVGSGSISTDRFRSFVYRVLVSWRGSKMVKFAVIFLSRHDQSLYNDIDLWVGFAIEKGVEHLHVELQYPVDVIRSNSVARERMYLPPRCLYSCSSLHQLQLTGCHLQIHGSAPVQWHHLQKLYIDCFGLTQPVIGQVLDGSPKLERFELHVVENNLSESLSIESISLRYLLIENYLLDNDGDHDVPKFIDLELIISTPNLETLKICGVHYSNLFLMNVSSLTAAAFRLYTGPTNSDRELLHRNYVLRDMMLGDILPSIQHVEQLKLSAWCIKAVGGMDKTIMPPNVKLLKLYVYSFQEYDDIVSLLVNFPELEKLVLQPDDKGVLGDSTAKTKSLETSCHLLNPFFLLQLSRVKVTWTDDHSIFPFIEMLLKCASNLQMLVFRVRGMPTSSLLAAQTKLLRMPRSSPTAQVFCYEC